MLHLELGIQIKQGRQFLYYSLNAIEKKNFISTFTFFHIFCMYTHIVNCFPRNFWLPLLINSLNLQHTHTQTDRHLESLSTSIERSRDWKLLTYVTIYSTFWTVIQKSSLNQAKRFKSFFNFSNNKLISWSPLKREINSCHLPSIVRSDSWSKVGVHDSRRRGHGIGGRSWGQIGAWQWSE